MRRIERHERRVAVAPLGDLFEQLLSAGSFAAITLSSGNIARASASVIPAHSPNDVALRSTATQPHRVVDLRDDDERRRIVRGVRRLRAIRARCLRVCLRPSPLQPVCRKTRKPQRHDPPSVAVELPEETIVTIPLHHPMPRRPVSVAHELYFEDGVAPVFVCYGRARCIGHASAFPPRSLAASRRNARETP